LFSFLSFALRTLSFLGTPERSSREDYGSAMAFALLASLGQTSEFNDKINHLETFTLDLLEEQDLLTELKLYNDKLLSLYALSALHSLPAFLDC